MANGSNDHKQAFAFKDGFHYYLDSVHNEERDATIRVSQLKLENKYARYLKAQTFEGFVVWERCESNMKDTQPVFKHNGRTHVIVEEFQELTMNPEGKRRNKHDIRRHSETPGTGNGQNGCDETNAD